MCLCDCLVEAAANTVNHTAEEIDAWEEDFNEKQTVFLRECAYFLPSLELTREAKLAWSCDRYEISDPRTGVPNGFRNPLGIEPVFVNNTNMGFVLLLGVFCR